VPLRGDEIRACWDPSVASVDDPSDTVRRSIPAPLDADGDRTPVRKLEFVEVDPAPVKARRRAAGSEPGTTEPGVADLPPAITPGEPRWSLWSDAEV
jgi:hypothetical protein